jgi:YaiO family outer membrane protein
VRAAYPLAPHETVYGQIEYLNEYNLSDGDAFAGIYYPITKDLTAVVEGEVGFAQKITPVWSLFGELQYKLFKGFLIDGGFRNSDYHNILQSTNQVQIFNIGAEYWFSNFRAAYTFYESRGNGGIWNPPSHLVEFGYYYGDANSITLGAGIGHEVDLIVFSGGSPFLDVFNTKTIFLLGRHWFSLAWGISYEIGWNQMDQGFSTNTLYDRYGIRLGIRHRF